MKRIAPTGGHQRIYEDLLGRLRHADLAASAAHLGLALNDAGEIAVPFLGKTFLISHTGVRQSDGKPVNHASGSVVIHYVLKAGRRRPTGTFVTFAQLAGPLFKQGAYSASALERPIVKRFQGRVAELIARAAGFGGHPGGESGLGSVSLIVELLPHVLLQLIFYDRDEEFPARATLLFDSNASHMIDFETLAVAVTRFVQTLTQ